MKRKTFTGGLIGKQVKIVQSSNPSDVAIEGIIVDETKNTIKIKQEKMTKTIMKKNVTIELDGKLIDGKTLLKRPEERIK
ncbi:MAG: ribonuclease P [Nanoarchaeota archaeon]|nr:ribonuclease P [Nanoarchaeota archaeon]|tara:strand:+ start:4464 stop:4703 length:240 start_codon:yes stop_codon:yes gene_type:complete